MPTALREGQHELLDADGTSLLVFGTADTLYLTTEYPSLEPGDARTGDVERVFEDGIAFGEDFNGPESATFQITVLTTRDANRHRAGAEALQRIKTVWTHPDRRDENGKVSVLRSHLVDGRLLRAYGRPRRYGESPSMTTPRGGTSLVCDFLIGDGRWYGDVEQSASVNMVPPYEGGLTSPLKSPLQSTAAATSAGRMTVGGDLPTWPVITFHGPIVNPSVTIGQNMTVGLLETIPAGVSITIDPRPWARSVLRNDGAGKGGRLTWETPPLSDMQLRPGQYGLVLKGNDATGSAWVDIRWRNAQSRW